MEGVVCLEAGVCRGCMRVGLCVEGVVGVNVALVSGVA